jgi:hypothetical protein
LQAQKRVGQFTFNAHWTWSNNVSNHFITEDPYNVTNRWSREPLDRRHYVKFNTQWAMLFGRGKRFLASAPGAVDRVLGGWTLQTISYFATGTYFSPAFSGSDPSNTNTVGGPAGPRGRRKLEWRQAYQVPGGTATAEATSWSGRG